MGIKKFIATVLRFHIRKEKVHILSTEKGLFYKPSFIGNLIQPTLKLAIQVDTSDKMSSEGVLLFSTKAFVRILVSGSRVLRS